MARLAVNIDHVATLREARGTRYPDPVVAASLAEMAGADGIIVHLREDRRHIKERDLKILRNTVQTRLNLEMAAVKEMVDIALMVKPDIVTFVPERREELTTEGGLDVNLHRDDIQRFIGLLKEGGIRVSLFIDPDLEQVKASHRVGTNIIEIHTGRYCEARNREEEDREFKKIEQSISLGVRLGLAIAAGHGIHYHNVQHLTQIKEIEEFNIGHSIVSRAVLVGFAQAVREMKELIG